MLLNFFSSFVLIWVFMLCMQKLILASGLLTDFVHCILVVILRHLYA